MVLPMIVGLITVPELLNKIGAERLGVLSIAWMLVGYLGVLDLGLGRALTRAIGEQNARGVIVDKQISLSREATRYMVLVGVFWMIVIVSIAPFVTEKLLNIPNDLQIEAKKGFLWLAVAVPFMLYATSRVAILEGQQRFRRVNAIKIPLGMATFIAPLGMSYFDKNIEYILASLLGVRVCAAISFGLVANWPSCSGKVASCDKNEMRELFFFGGWLTISNIVSPILAYFDRFFIGAMLSMTAVTYYTIPQDVLVRLTALPIAIMGVLFPLLSKSHFLLPEETTKVVRSAAIMFSTVWFSAIGVAILVADDFLSWWVGSEVSSHVVNVWYILAVGVFINGFSHLPYNIIQSAGRSDVTAKIHVIELIPYLVLMFFCISFLGIEGAAFAWSLRVVFDSSLLFLAASKVFHLQRREISNAFFMMVFCALTLVALCYVKYDYIRYGIVAFFGFVLLKKFGLRFMFNEK
ncbi:flippase [Quatrionicoccus australiensis]|nr:flippase [Quatrionicoccus australiensis]